MDLSTDMTQSPPTTITPNGTTSQHHQDHASLAFDDETIKSTNQPFALDTSSLTSPTTANPAALTSPDRRPKKSSSTCTTCRARKVRCNGARDICSNCQRLGFPCSYDDTDAAAWNVALPRRRVKQACQSCHSRKARCSGHVPACDRCRVQGIECVYRPAKRARLSKGGGIGAAGGGGGGGSAGNSGRESPQSQDEEMDDVQNDSDPGLTDPGSTSTPTAFPHEVPGPHGTFDALIGSTFEKFFRHVHHIPTYGFLHRASLMEQYHSGKVDKSLLLALIGITSSLTDMGPGMREYGDRCIDEAEQRIFADYTRPSAIKVQALVFMIKHRQLAHKFPSAFFLLSLASRYAASLRLNYEAPNLCFLAQESRRRLMWALFCIDVGTAGGNPDFSLWRDDVIQVTLPCNERNFEFDLPQPAEKLIPESNAPTPNGDDIGSHALHVRIQHIRKKIAEFSKSVLRSKDIHASRMQTSVLTLHKELDDFAAQLPTSFQFSESSLHLRAYSPRLCVFVMIHLWWRQCHVDLYRIGLVGLRDALPRSVLDNISESFLEHCLRQCIDHSTEIVNIFSACLRMRAQMVADIDLAMCAYQSTRILTYAHHINAEKFDLGADVVMERANVCVQVIKDYCRGKATVSVRTDLEKLVAHSLRNTSRGGTPSAQAAKAAGQGRNASKGLLRNVQTQNAHGGTTTSPLPPAVVANPWSSENHMYLNDPLPQQDIQVHRGNGNTTTTTTTSQPKSSQQQQQPPTQAPPPPPQQPTPISHPSTTTTADPAPSSSSSELNNAFEGALDGFGLENGLDYAMSLDMSMWTNTPDSSGGAGGGVGGGGNGGATNEFGASEFGRE